MSRVDVAYAEEEFRRLVAEALIMALKPNARPCAFRDCGDPSCHLCALARTSPALPVRDLQKRDVPALKAKR